ncbi:hypothetical protein [Bradyrhizobium erythrophlei]|uniref:Uncharacterized protein n=1 Tax=Bradyrhizobium erythrophlei TaxID=1437360 RepID=A0A1M5NKL1_9BRAD|nr:hypothetical protein [Bradyrhizobium erythrophlei]SHG90090.1 hypothetical protein SAMN05443248_3032 [Bradyrhizobium erythrophlei]
MTRDFKLGDRVRDGGLQGVITEIRFDAPPSGVRHYAVIDTGDGVRHWRYLGEIELATDAAPVSYELQGSGYDPGACGYELQGRKSAP